MVNCWQVKNCGREPGGAKVQELGVCPAAEEKSVHQVNGGQNGGRICWALAGTLCGGKVQGSFVQKAGNCVTCEFYLQVRREQGTAFVNLPPRSVI